MLNNKPRPRPSDHRCNARLLKRHGHCQRPAGWGTPHPGAGRCKLHGGCAHAANITHGRYCKGPFPRIADLQQQYGKDPDPLNLLRELATQRALLHDFLERHEKFQEALFDWHASYTTGHDDPSKKPKKVLDIADAYKIVESITRIVERIFSMRNQDAVGRDQLVRLLENMWRILLLEIENEETRGRIKRAWGELRVV